MTQTAARIRTVVLVGGILAGIAIVEMGVRSVPASGYDPTGASQPAAVRVPGPAAPFADRIRAAPAAVLGRGTDASVVSGVVFGQAAQLDPGVKQRFLDCGLWHLLAASGENVALVTGVVLALLHIAGAPARSRAPSAALAIVVYTTIAGGGASLVRAALMALVGVAAGASGRLRDTWDALLVSMLVLVWWAPGVHRSLGFQLSYACVGALLAWCAPIVRALRQLRMPHRLAEGVAATLICSAVTAPILLFTKGGAPVLGAGANLVAVPLAGAVLIVGIAGAVAYPLVPAIGAPALQVSGLLAGLLVRIARIASDVPGTQVRSWVALGALAALGICCVLVVRSRSKTCEALGPQRSPPHPL